MTAKSNLYKSPQLEDGREPKPPEIVQGTSTPEAGPASNKARKARAPRAAKVTKVEPKAGIPSESPEDTYKPGPFKLGPLSDEELDADEAEFRRMRRDVDGVKGAASAGTVTISVRKAPPKNEFFRVHPTFAPSVPIVNVEKGMEKHYFAVAPQMVAPLAAIGITVAYHTLYLTVTSGETLTVVPVRDADEGGESANEYDATKAIAMRRGRTEWVRLYTDMPNRCYKVFPAPEGRFSDPSWPDLFPKIIFRLAFRDKGRLIDSVDHPLFQKWAAKDRSDSE